MSSGAAFENFRAMGCAAVVGSGDRRSLVTAVEAVRAEIADCDLACSRFRSDSELSRLNQPVPAGRYEPVSPWLAEALEVALYAAYETDGLVDPTVGQCLIDLGYDRDFDHLDLDLPLVVTARHVPLWQHVRAHADRHLVWVPKGARFDLGATAKALCADRAAGRAASVVGTGVLVSLGGDLSVAGPAPSEGWAVRVTDRADTSPDALAPGQTVAIRSGGLATSGTAARRWARGGQELHHLVDPSTGRSADEVWRTVSVAASSCVEANLASTAAVILGEQAPRWLARRGVDARLVTTGGGVVLVGGWPTDDVTGRQCPPEGVAA